MNETLKVKYAFLRNNTDISKKSHLQKKRFLKPSGS